MTGLPATKFCAIEVPRLAEEALWQELELTPKPGWWTDSTTGSSRYGPRSVCPQYYCDYAVALPLYRAGE